MSAKGSEIDKGRDSYDVVTFSSDEARMAALKFEAEALREAMGVVGERYLRLCELIRKGGYTKPEVRKVLEAAGFSRPRIAEIGRVSFCSEEIFEDFRRRLIGWKAVLGKIRDEDSEKPEVALLRKWNLSMSALDRLWAREEPPQRVWWLNGHAFMLLGERELEAGGEFRLGKFRVVVELEKLKKPRKKQKQKRKLRV